MRLVTQWRKGATLLLCGLTGLGAHSTLLLAAEPLGNRAPLGQMEAPATDIKDVALGDNGRLAGMVSDHQGAPLPGRRVFLRQEDREVASVETDAAGRFTIEGLRGGVYTASAGETDEVYRFWQPGTAPPRAIEAVQLYGGNDIVRGQHFRARNFFTSPLFIGGAIGTAIAIPLALHDREPTS